MIVKVSKDELYKRLGDIQNIAEKKTTIPILSNFLLEVSREKSTVYATDLEMAIGEPIEIIEIEKSGVICLPARKIFEIAKEVAGDIHIEEDDMNWIKMKSGKSSYRIAALNPDEYPHWPTLGDNTGFQIKTEKLADMLDRTIYCAGENDPRYALNGVLFHVLGKDKKIILVGTDGHRLAVIYSDMEMDTEEEIKAILPRRAVMELRRLITGLQDDIRFEIAKNHIRFFLGEKVFLTKLIEGTYPNYEQVIPVNNNKSVVMDREEFTKTLRRVSVIGREKSRVVRVDLEKDQINVFATDPELGEAQDGLKVEYDGEPITLGFNSRYVLEAVASMKSQNIIMELLDTLTPTLLLEEGNKDYKCVLMPMRI
ncbi:DNA polymerase III subunit beta [Candidatus Magnetominusculus xianensis]|uniref:Beta sliding clamp n=1 Tax=Candidatus Magnetominusculus xianensis TaxID=1748249 RepID=A0ABR5SFL1_9BACT|nr:DNA polymerase III subunit beta [Candidatus Magnetominusculus xianensis]KWT84428.1 DNA polymerase III subunit beta [Candidatus Magnetominusculus xianensis]MBF0404262.1 DNA polymerase III subunit beta [Nitrospirota bacterium]